MLSLLFAKNKGKLGKNNIRHYKENIKKHGLTHSEVHLMFDKIRKQILMD